MPIQWLMEYWEAKADSVLPFLQGRPVGMELKFEKRVIFRRRQKGGDFIAVETHSDVMYWARQHCYSFHPHLEDGFLYFILDIDRRDVEVPLALAGAAAAELASLLDELGVEYSLKFSGRRGFHFYWAFDQEQAREAGGGEPWPFERRVIVFLRDRLEERLQAGQWRGEFYRYLSPDDPITLTNSADPEHARSLLLDENIVHHNGSLRSPWSVHPESGLVSLPLQRDELEGFQAQDATPEKALERSGPTEVPRNSVSSLLALLR
ncbi:MAG: hypothetical protein HPY83_02040 [Anaerolineae bacterium]|nr:hypothetical protein [Anaerolineae bacterium]